MAAPTIPQPVLEDLRKLSLLVPPGELERLSAYLDKLLETNQRFNLTAIRDRDTAWRRHIIDSLTLLPLLQELAAGSHLIDVGSGGGLPGIPLAITRPDLHITLLEATGKKARFLEECARDLPLPNVRVLNERAEHVGQDRKHRQQFDVAVARAIGPLAELLEYTLPLVRIGGRVLAMKGPGLEQELEAAKNALAVLGSDEAGVFDAYPPGFGMQTVILQVNKARPTPKAYPRAAGTPRLHPL